MLDHWLPVEMERRQAASHLIVTEAGTVVRVTAPGGDGALTMLVIVSFRRKPTTTFNLQLAL